LRRKLNHAVEALATIYCCSNCGLQYNPSIDKDTFYRPMNLASVKKIYSVANL